MIKRIEATLNNRIGNRVKGDYEKFIWERCSPKLGYIDPLPLITKSFFEDGGNQIIRWYIIIGEDHGVAFLQVLL